MKNWWSKGVVVSAVAMAVAPLSARAARVLQWDPNPAPGVQGGTGVWNTTLTSWDDNGTSAQWINNGQDTAVFGATAGGTVSLVSAVSAAAVRFDVAGYVIGTPTGLTLTLPGGSAIANANAVINAPVNAATGLTKSGPGVLTLGSTNTIGGAITITGGTLQFGGEANLGSTQNDVRLAGGTLRYSAAAPLILAAGRTVLVDTGGGGIDTPAGVLTLAANNQLTGGGTLNKLGAQTLRIVAPNTTFAGAFRVSAGTLSVEFEGGTNGRPITLSGGHLQLRADVPMNVGSALIVDGDAALDTTRISPLAPEGLAMTLGDATIGAGATLSVTGSNRNTVRVGSLDLSGGLRIAATAVVVGGAFSGSGTATFGVLGSQPETFASGLIFAGPGTQTVSANVSADESVVGQPVLGVRSGGAVTFGGNWQGGGTAVSNFVVLREGGKFTLGPAAQVNTIAIGGVASRPFTVIGTGPGDVFEVDGGFVADHTQGGTVADGLASLDVRNATLVTRGSVGLPVVAKNDGFGGTHRAGAITFSGTSGAAWVVAGADQRYDGRITFDGPTTLRTDRNLTHLGVTSQKFDGQFEVTAGNTLLKEGGGRLTLAGAQGFAPGSVLQVRAGAVRFDADPGAGWYAGNFTRGANGDVTASPPPAGTLAVVVGGTAGAAVEFTAPVNRLASLQVDAGGTARVVALAQPSVGPTLVTDSLTVNPGGRLDLEGNALVVRYAPNASPLATIAAKIALAFSASAGPWQGEGITSSSAATAADTGVGFGEASDLLGITGAQTGMFGGVSVGADSVLVRWTALGDADLDGRVTFSDFQRLERGFGKSGAWSNGDFNYDGVVNRADFMILYHNFGRAAALPVQASASVPEPGALAWGGTICILGLRRRRAAGPSRNTRCTQDLTA